MKKEVFLILIALMTNAITKGQIQRDNVLIGTNISNFNLSLNKGGAFSMRIDPKAAWFVRDNTAFGAYLSFALETARGTGSKTSYGLGILTRTYLSGDALTAVRHTCFFVEGNIGMEGSNNNQTVPKTSTNGLGVGIGPGIAYFITPNIGLEGLVKYASIVGFGTTATTNNINLGIGFQVYLPTKTIKRAATNSQQL